MNTEIDTATTRPLVERITQGPIARRDKTSHPIHLHNTAEPSKTIANVFGNSETIEANAELITEAFNVTHETGRTPRQLADERAELILSLANMLACADAGDLDSLANASITTRELLNRLEP